MFTDLVSADGVPWPTCTRSALRRVAELARKELGTVRLGFEQEGYLLRMDGERYTPLHRGKQFTAEILDAEDGFISDLASALAIMGIPLEKITAEGGWGMFEVNFGADEPVGAVEHYFRFKHAFRANARQHGYVGSFMPKPFQDGTGAGLHVHISLVDALDGRDLLHDRSDPRGVGLSMLGHYFLGGLLAHAEAITALGAPSVNSYKRLRPGTWAPTHVTYGVGNRSAMIRIVQNREVPTRCAGALPSVQRLEVRSADGTCNPYLLAAILLAAGLDGVRRSLDPGPPINTDVAPMSEAELAECGLRPLPRSLDRALDGLAADDVAAEIVGPAIVNGFLKAKRIEWDKFAAHVSAWEHRYYAEFY
jgi:glutamine synthetase